MSKKIKQEGILVFENFQNSTFFSREVSPDSEFLHRIVSSPTYLFKSVDNSLIQDMGDCSYPLLSLLPRGEINLTSNDGYPVAFLQPTNTNDQRIFYVATNKGFVRAIKIDGVARNLGQPISNPSQQNLTSLIIFTDKIFFINPSSSNIFHIPETTTGTSWTSIGGVNSPMLAETFSTFLFIADRNSSSDSNRRLVRVYNTSYSNVGNLDLGSFWDIQDIANNNNRFVVVIANPFGITSNQYAFLWDGAYQNRYFHAIKLPGEYVGSINYMGAFLMFIKVGGSTNIYELSGYSLRFVDTLLGINVPTTLLPKQRFINYGNYILFPASFNDLSLNGYILYNVLEKETIFINTGSSSIVGGLITNDLSGNIRIFYTDLTNDKIKMSLFLPSGSFDNYVNTSSPFQTLSDELIYVSNRVNFFNRVKIDKIEVFYGSKPPSGNVIKIETIMRDKRLNTQTTEVSQINLNYLDNFVLIGDIGATGDQLTLRVKLTNTSSYKTNIKRIVVYYSNLL